MKNKWMKKVLVLMMCGALAIPAAGMAQPMVVQAEETDTADAAYKTNAISLLKQYYLKEQKAIANQGKKEEAEKYMNAAGEMAKEWEMAAYAGDHYRLAFDQPDSWGMKYNLVWDRLLGLNLFPERVIQKETDFYLTKMNEFGCPLDSRHSYTKVDWTVWTASLSADRMQFRKLMLPLHKFMNETTDRTPMADLINTDGKTIVGFTGRTVVGAYFIRLLEKE